MHWVETKHRLPEKGVGVLMFRDVSYAVGFWISVQHEPPIWISLDDGWQGSDPTHWMLLEPPVETPAD